MDWAAHDHRPRGAADAPTPPPLAVCWRLVGPSGRLITCAIYAGPAGRFEVRAGYSTTDLLRSHVVRTPEAAQDVAAIWKLAALEKGFVDVDAPSS